MRCVRCRACCRYVNPVSGLGQVYGEETRILETSPGSRKAVGSFARDFVTDPFSPLPPSMLGETTAATFTFTAERGGAR